MVNFFGVKIEDCSKREIFEKINSYLNGNFNRSLNEPKGKFIVTLNSEILLKAEADEKYRDILNKADLRIIDGFGIKLVGLLRGVKTGERMAGADLAEYILGNYKERKFGLVMKRRGLSEKGDLRFKIEDLGIKKYSIIYEDEDLTRVKDLEILLVGLGAPEQERFIWENKERFPSLKIAIGVGGTFDYWTGKKRRAPKVMRKLGLEWLWRLIIQPNRFFRIWNATVVFVWKALRD